VLGGGHRHHLRPDREGHLGHPQPAVRVGAGLQADRPPGAGEEGRVDGGVAGAFGAAHRVPTHEAVAERRAQAREHRHLDRAEVGDGRVGVDGQPVQRGGHGGQRHGQDDDAGQLLGDPDPAGRRGVPGGRVDVPAADVAPGGGQRRGE
jgi:hypothetical protein